MAERNISFSSDDNYDDSNMSSSTFIDNSETRLSKESSFDVRPDRVTTAERNLLEVGVGEVVFNLDTGENEYWNGSAWVGEGVNQPVNIDSRVIVNQANVATTLGGAIDSSKEYFIDGQVDLGTIEIVVPQGGLSIRGLSFAVSALFSTSPSTSIFRSEDFSIGSGSLLMSDIRISSQGKVFDLANKATGLGVIGIENTLFFNCADLGNLIEYDQMLMDDVQIVGGTPTLEMIGTWSSGFRSSGLLIRQLSASMTSPIFKAGFNFLVGSRFILDTNVDLPTSASLCDFSNSNFVNPSAFQIVASEVTRNGVLDAMDSNITPNIDQTDLASDWSKNNGMRNTFVGGSIVNTAEVLTIITAPNVAVDLDGTFLAYDMEHFDAPSNGRLRHLGINPTEYRVTWDFVLEGRSNESYEIRLIHFSGSTPTLAYSQVRVVNNLSGGRDVAYYNGVANIILNENDFCFWQIVNLDSSQSCTLEDGSMFDVEAR